MSGSKLPTLIQTMPLVARARHWAEWYHGAQLYGGLPYINHLDAVAETLYVNGYDTPTWICAGFLHDILEDTACDYEKLIGEDGFSVAIANLVHAVSGNPDASREEHCEIMYERIAKLPEASILKIADRVANLEALIARLLEGFANKDRQLYLNLSRNYLAEHDTFVHAVVVLAPYKMRDLYMATYNKFFEACDKAREGEKI